jgi:hypothetical protein
MGNANHPDKVSENVSWSICHSKNRMMRRLVAAKKSTGQRSDRIRNEAMPRGHPCLDWRRLARTVAPSASSGNPRMGELTMTKQIKRNNAIEKLDRGSRQKAAMQNVTARMQAV